MRKLLLLQQISTLKAIFKQEGFQKYFKNTSWLLAERVFRIFASLFVGVWVARHLGPSDYGAFQFAFSFVSIFTAIATLGLDEIVVRELVKDESKKNALLGTSFFLKALGGVASLIILIICIQFINYESAINKMILLIGSASIIQCFNVIDLNFRSKVQSKFVTYAGFFSLLISSLTKVGLILMDAPVVYFAMVVVLEAILLAIAFIYYYVKTSTDDSIFNWYFDRSLAKELLSDSWPLIFSGMVLMVQARIDQVMLKELSSNEEVGYYSVALRLVEIFGFIPVLIQGSLLPSLINSKKASEELYKKRLLNYYRLNFILFIGIAIPIALCSNLIISVLYGADFLAAVPLLALMSIRLLFADMGVARGSFINIENLFKFSMLTMIIGTVVNIVLNYFWIPQFLSIGAIYSTLVSFTVTIFVVDFFYVKTRPNVLMQIKAMLTFYAIKLDFLKKEEE